MRVIVSPCRIIGMICAPASRRRTSSWNVAWRRSGPHAFVPDAPPPLSSRLSAADASSCATAKFGITVGCVQAAISAGAILFELAFIRGVSEGKRRR
ncbi:hypothetical protein SJA_C1-18410 [Sphingobium indicum UT26S]|uniref:Uncharacterized protein n=1 Tax=Sphingobium indicum (strain DSM 16413 / CCM 7287 / MTCC 6362 / UT26 / NBRC 101211 / UT26S) TaxID=452662 RepID=D4Z243_SPHIU|nr:hypothetical protein SJA_C1-18410 [Sphingobium indicum UT26S]